MRRALFIVTVAALMSILAQVIGSPNKTVAGMRATKSGFHNVVVVDGLHVALPTNMRSFPVELVPLP